MLQRPLLFPPSVICFHMFPGFDILYDDDSCLVVSKPGGLLTQAPLGIDSLEFRIKRLLRERSPAVEEIYLGVPHRLDRPVSGVIVFAKTRKAARRISEQFEGRRVQKKYWALVPGSIEPDQGTWTDYLKKTDGDPRTAVVTDRDSAGQIAILHYQVRQRLEDATLLEIELETGRTHQIRVQCASRGHALLGDELYGSRVPFGPPSDDQRLRLIALHARSLSFQHPSTREPIHCIAPLPDYWPTDGGPAV